MDCMDPRISAGSVVGLMFNIVMWEGLALIMTTLLLHFNTSEILSLIAWSSPSVSVPQLNFKITSLLFVLARVS